MPRRMVFPRVGPVAAFGLVVSLAASAVAQSQTDDVKFDYNYERPAALGEIPAEVAMPTALPAPKYDFEQALARGETKALKLAQVLGVKLQVDRQTRSVDQHGEVLRIKDGRYRLKVYVPSGMVKFRDTKLYNQDPEDEKLLPVMSDEEAVRKTRDLMKSLAQAELLEADQLLDSDVHISHRREQDVRGANQGERGRPDIRPAPMADTRVFVPRAVNGVGISGHGVQITYSKGGQVAGLDLYWRDLAFEVPPLRIRFSLDEVKKRFEESLVLPRNAQVEVQASDLVYFDPSKRDPVAFLEPAFLFVYRVRTPLPDSEEFAVSKVLHAVIPAVAHGRTQLESPRALRLKHFNQAPMQRRDEDEDIESENQ
jgi:hypothetical protein